MMFDGFNLIHSGGYPTSGCRKSLFINFRFPLSKVVPKFKYRFFSLMTLHFKIKHFLLTVFIIINVRPFNISK